MAPLERWYKKWEGLADDSDDTDSRSEYCLEQAALKLPPDLAESLRRERNPRKRCALMAVNYFIGELHGPPQTTPSMQQRLLRALSDAMRNLEEGGEVETLLWQVRSVLLHPKVAHAKLEQAVGACALTISQFDSRLVKVILLACLDRIRDFSSASIARVCWSAACLSDKTGDDASRLLQAALQCAEDKIQELGAEDASLLVWACETAHPSGTARFLERLKSQPLTETVASQKNPQLSRRTLEGFEAQSAQEVCGAAPHARAMGMVSKNADELSSTVGGRCDEASARCTTRPVHFVPID